MRGSTPRHRSPSGRGWTLGLLLATAAACGGGSGGDGGSSTGGGATGDSTAAGGTTFATPDACMASDECETSGHCIAPYDPAPDEGEAMRGPAACVDACIEEDDLLRWCLDDDACCGDLRCNEVDGFCEAPLSADGTTEVPATGTGSGSSGDTGSGSGSSGSSGSGSETGSSSGAGSDSGSSSSG